MTFPSKPEELTMDRRWTVEESIAVAAPPEAVYGAVSDVRRMGEWSPECRAVWAGRGPLAAGSRFVGFNRRGPYVWFTTCRVTVANPGQEFAFQVGSFGLPVAVWGYRFEPEGSGTRVTEYWRDLRTGRTGGLTSMIGRVFTGTQPEDFAELNRAGMRTTLERISRAIGR